MKRTLIKGIAWKEWRENRMVPLWTALCMGLLIIVLHLTHTIAARESVAFLFGGWMLAGVLAGSGLIAREVGSDTLQFLMSLPISRRQVWWMKMRAGIKVLIASMLVTSLVWSVLHPLLFGNDAFDRDTLLTLDSAGWYFAAGFCCFGVAIAISSLLDRAISAAMVSIVTCIALMIPLAFFNSIYRYRGADENGTIIISAVLLLPGLLAASYFAFTRGESLRTHRRFWYAGAGLAVGLAMTWAPATAGYIWLTRFQPGNSNISLAADPVGAPFALSPKGNLVALQASTLLPGQHSSRTLDTSPKVEDHLVIESPDGRSVRRVLPGSSILAWSPDGRYLVFGPQVNAIGLRLVDKAASVLDVQTGRILPIRFDWLNSQQNYNNDISAATWSSDGNWLAVSAYPWRQVFINRAELFAGKQSLRVITTDPNHHIGFWSPSEDIYYTTSQESLVAVTPRILRGQPGESTDPRSENPAWEGAHEPGEQTSYPLCHLETGTELQVTRNPHRTLVIVHTPGVLYGDRQPKNEYWVIDLAAATSAALRSQPESVPDMREWLHRWSVRPEAHFSLETGAFLTPDGRYLLSRDSLSLPHGRTVVIDLQDSKLRHQALTNANSPSAGTWRYDGYQYSLREDRFLAWLPDGHRYVEEENPSKWYIIDPADQSRRPIPVNPDEYVFGVSSSGHILVAPRQIQDLWHPITRTIPA